MVRIRSEHAIGFLKGRWHSLKHLRVRITDERSHKFATYWIAACVGLHAFAMQCEEDERIDDDDGQHEDPFIAEGLSSSSSDDDRGRYTEPHVAGESPGSPQVVPGNPQGVQGVPEESLRSPPRTPWGSVLI